jgi:hypothetical protein
VSVPKPSEQSIVNACLHLLHLRGVFAWRVNQGAMKTASGGFVRFNKVEGVSDIVGVLPACKWNDGGRFIAVEAKRPGLGKKSRPAPHQQAFLDAVAKCGGLALCVTDVQELDAALTAEGL